VVTGAVLVLSLAVSYQLLAFSREMVQKSSILVQFFLPGAY
jgi:hypothetical protein